MAKRGSWKVTSRGHAFGGDWTNAKLDVLAKYLAAYTKALREKPSKARPFQKAYVDAFAGTGYREARSESESKSGEPTLPFPDLADTEPQTLLAGSASRALRIEPHFDNYVFIDRSPVRCAQLEALREEFPELARRIQVCTGDANVELRELCSGNWDYLRAVMFLDPYGMEVEWTTIEAIAKTRAIDLWVLFPLGIGVNRLLKRSGEIPSSWRKRLNLLLGKEDWYDEFYTRISSNTLFGEEESIVKASTETIGRYFNERLSSVFAGVAPEPKVLRNSRNCPLYLLCFAASNVKGAPIALRIANSLLKGVD